MEKKKLRAPFLIGVSLWLIALGFATVYDLEISLAIADKNSVFGRFFEIAGEPPAILFASFNFALIMAYQMRCTELKVPNRLKAAIFAVLSGGTVFYTFIKTYNYCLGWADDAGIDYRLELVVFLITCLVAAIVAAIFIITALTFDETRLRAIYQTAKSCAAAAIATFVLIWIFKLTWGRIRFRDLFGDVQSLFTPWYLPRWFSGNFSFPSGHTANATVICSSLFYMRFLPEHFKWLKLALCVLIGIWIAVVAFSRVCVGAHYLSDVLFGAAITLSIVYFVRPRNNT